MIKGSVAGGRDSTFGGQGFWPKLTAGQLCNTDGQACTVLAGKVGLQLANQTEVAMGKKAGPENGMHLTDLNEGQKMTGTRHLHTPHFDLGHHQERETMDIQLRIED